MDQPALNRRRAAVADPARAAAGPVGEAQVCPGLPVPVNRSTATGQRTQQFGIRVALAVAAEPLALPEAAVTAVGSLAGPGTVATGHCHRT